MVLLILIIRGSRRGALLGIIGAIGVGEAILNGLLLNLSLRQFCQVMGRLDVADLLAVALGEDEVDLLQGATRGLGVEEVHDREEDGVHGGEEEIGAPADGIDHDGRDHDDGKVEEPVGAGRDGVGLGTSSSRRELGGVEPWQREHGGTEEGHIEEETEHGTLGRAITTGDQTGEDDDHGNHLTTHAAEEQLPATDLFDKEPGESGEDGVDDHVDTTDEHRHELCLTQ